MEKNKNKIADLAVNAGKNAADFFGKTVESVVKAVDQNDDGTFDFKDVAVIAESIGNSAKTAVAAAKDSAEAKNREIERNQLRPLFPEDLDSPGFLMSKLLRITEIDKKRAESPVCQGSIGYTSILKDMRIVNIYRDKIGDFGLKFYPDVDFGMYYIDPSDRNHYIALDEYFLYMKRARLAELQKIAQDLGAIHFKVTYKELESSFSSSSVKGKASVKSVGDNGNAEVDYANSHSEKSSFRFAAENVFPGHAPVMPKLCYLKHDSFIQSLVEMRMDPASPTKHQVLSLQLSNTSGIKEKDAIKIDAALKALKISGDINMTSEAKSEAHQFFEYEIDF